MSNSLEFSCWSGSVVAAALMLAAYPQLLAIMDLSAAPLLEATCVSVVLGSGFYLCVDRLAIKVCGLWQKMSAYQMRHGVSSVQG